MIEGHSIEGSAVLWVLSHLTDLNSSSEVIQSVVLWVLSPLTDLNLIMFLQGDIAGVGSVQCND